MLNYKNIFYKALQVFLYLFLTMGCQSDPQPAQDAKLPPEKAPINKTQKSAKVINPARLSAKILLAKTEYLKLKKDCERLWELFDKRRDPESWVALVATIQLNSSGAPCRDFLKTKIERNLKNSFLAEEDNQNSIKKDLERFKFRFLLQLAYEPGQSRIDDLNYLLKTYPGLKSGEFFSKGSLRQNVILQNLFCSPIGAILAKRPGDLAKFGEKRTYIQSCFSREIKRNFFQTQKGKTPHSS
ncbi:MAG: hypothetical protein IIA62_03165 [Nitrospinae bacterium]|nr:hypothetical protein [Nitrospinota bacterium]